MNLKVVTLCLAAFAMQPLQAGLVDKAKIALGLEKKIEAPAIKVLIATDLAEAAIEVKGKYNIYDPYQGTKLAACFAPKSDILEPLDSGMRWGEAFPGVYQLCFTPDLPTTTTVVNGIEYRGKILVYNIEGRLNIVNEVLVEDYISSLLSSAIENPLPEEVLAAVAITARTDACYRALHAKNRYWHVAAKDVGYYGYGVTDFRKGVEKAVKETRYFVLSSFSKNFQKVSPFPTHWGNEIQDGFSINKACALAQKGADTPKIIASFFPESRIASLEELPKEKPVKRGRG